MPLFDNILFVSTYGHKSILEARTRPAFRVQVLAQITKEAKENLDAFYTSWKDFHQRFPVQSDATEPAELDSDIMERFFDDPAPASAAEPAPAAATGLLQLLPRLEHGVGLELGIKQLCLPCCMYLYVFA